MAIIRQYHEIKNPFDLHLARVEKSDLTRLLMEIAEHTGLKLVRIEYKMPDGSSFDELRNKKSSVIYPDLGSTED